MTVSKKLPKPETGWAFFLDVDGTLIEIACTPEEVTVAPAVLATLANLSDAFGGALALVSGRPLKDLDRMFAPLRLPSAGLHGLERRNWDGELFRAAAPPEGLKGILKGLRDFMSRSPGVMVEDKGLSLAIHYRAAPEQEEPVRRLVAELVAAAGTAFKIQQGKKVLEIQPAGANKGDAVAAYMAERPFAGRRPVFVGDDTTDENGFAAVNRLGGHSIRVGGAGRTEARWRVDSVEDILSWLFTAPTRMHSAAIA